MNACAPRLSLTLCAAALLAGTSLSAQSKNPSDYPLRLHVFNRAETNVPQHRQLDETRGEGRANLFAKGEVHAVDFHFRCDQNLRPSLGFDSYPAKWNRPGKELVLLVPVFGKAGAFFTCDLQTDLKDFAYSSTKGQIKQEPSEDFKAWMVRHDYDPEHGRNQPSHTDSKPAAKPEAR